MKKILFITSSFYPDPYVSSVRAKEFCRWLPAAGWKPYVVTKSYGKRVARDEFISAVNADTEVFYLSRSGSVSHEKPLRKKSVKNYLVSILGAYLLSPDVSILYWRGKLKKVYNYVEEIKPDVVITSGPPHSIHSVGLFLKKKDPQLLWVADFRDEFRNGKGYKKSLPTFLKSSFSWCFEKNVYDKADGLVFAIPAHYKWAKLKSSKSESRLKVILNGPPVELNPKQEAAIREINKKEWVITVIGFNDAPESLMLAKAIAHINLKSSALLRFIGSPPPDEERIKKLLDDKVEFCGALPHDAVMEQIKKADILVGILSHTRSRRIGISSKMFEYVSMPVPVLLINPTRPDKTMFSKLDGVFLESNASEESITLMLEKALNTGRSACFERALYCYERWNRKAQTHKLLNFIENL